MRKLIVLLGFCFCGLGNIFAQTIPVGSPQEELYRRKQLLGKFAASSFSIRPVAVPAAFDSLDNLMRLSGLTANIKPVNFANDKGVFTLLPVTWKQQLNTHHPYGWNDGSMIPAKGYQSFIAAGFFAKLGRLSIQLKPEFVYAANNTFNGYADNKTDFDVQNYYNYYNFIDNPEGFGNKPYTKAFWGQSSIRVDLDPVSIALSNENIWWGPGIQNSILMSNNAPGFKHIGINTTKPVQTPIGAFEAHIFGGRLEESEFSPLSKTTNAMGDSFVVPFRSEWRYLSGLNINYQPKWLPGLSLGFIRTFAAYNSDMQGIGDYIPFFVKLQKETGDQDNFDRDQRLSLYARWLFQKARAEVYFEYGINDNSFNFRSFLSSPDHSRSYLVGIHKLIPLTARENEFIQVNAEITQLSQTLDRLVRGAGSFYQHGGVRQGYTHLGQTLGAGTGTGGNFQTIKVNWVRDLKSIGIGFERYEHNADFYNDYIYDLNRFSRRWVDFALAAQGQWDYQNFIFNVKVQGIQSLNYQWYLKDYQPTSTYIPNNDIFNFHGELGITYRF